MFWNLVCWIRCKLGHPAWFDNRLCEYKGYRHARGFVWEQGRASLRCFIHDDAFDVWLILEAPFSETNYKPPCTIINEPLICEDYRR